MRRLLYFIYYLRELDRMKFKKFADYVRQTTEKSSWVIFFEIFTNSIRFNISILEYFQFRFYEKKIDEKKEWVGTGYIYEYQKYMNPKNSRNLLSDKLLFLNEYSKFVKHSYAGIEDLKSYSPLAKKLMSDSGDKLVLKSVNGQCGNGIQIIPTCGLDHVALIAKLAASGNDLAEEYVQQHEELNRLSPSGLNTLRLITQIDRNGKVDIIAARLRISVNCPVDNMAAGNLAAHVDMETGKIDRPAVYSDITKEDALIHPVTRVSIVGFEVPFFQESIEMIKEVALLHQQNRSVGWDVAITKTGPELIEGNHNWCKLLWQLPVQRGLKRVLEKYK